MTALRRCGADGFTRLLAAAVVGCGLLALGSPLREGVAKDLLLQDHPLVGSLWQTDGSSRVGEDALIAAALKSDWVLLGESHDNPDHHRLQARIVAELGARGRRPALVWEMAGPAQAEALAAARLDAVADLGAALNWEERGWYAWSIYQPIAEAALTHGMKMHPGNPSPETTQAIAHGEALPQPQRARLDWERDYDGEQRSDLMALLAASHCNALPESDLEAMADVQRLRDSWMAASLREADAGSGAILIAGAQHVRKDRGVPWRLGEAALSLALVEVEEGKLSAADYTAFDPRLFDFVWFTAKVEQEDHCARFFQKSDG